MTKADFAADGPTLRVLEARMTSERPLKISDEER
jgi:hypothetical protein